MNKIKEIKPDSVAQFLGITHGDTLTTINNRPINDYLDYCFLTRLTQYEVEIIKSNGRVVKKKIQDTRGLEFGAIFEDDGLNDRKKCSNKCIFCTPDQMPIGLIPEAYKKDDDYRSCAINRNYTTLVDLSYEGMRRMKELGIDQMNILVPALNLRAWRTTLGNQRARDPMKNIMHLAEAGIKMKVRINLCHGINDGEVLEDTITRLAELHPAVTSIGIRPARMTKHRSGLHYLKKFTPNAARQVMRQIIPLQRQFLKEKGTRFVFLADELYHMIGCNYPSAEHYEKFQQLDNAAGITAKFRQEYDAALENVYKLEGVTNKTVACGALFAPMLSGFVTDSPYDNIEFIELSNNLLGEDITVAEMISSKDLMAQVLDPKDFLLIPGSMLFGDRFIDNVKVEEVEKRLNTKILTFNMGEELLGKMLL